MPAPTLIATIQISSPWYQAGFNAGTGVATVNYASTLSTSAGDLIVTAQGAADAASSGTLTTTDGTNSYNQRTNIQNASHCSLNIATAADGSGGTRTITLNRSATSPDRVGGAAFQFRGHGGVGNVYTAADGIQTGDLSCSANSAILVICTDWNATSGTRTWATINGNSPTSTFGVDGDGATWSVAGAYWADVGAAGTKSITLSSPNFSAESFAAIEILAGADTAKRLSLLGVG